MLDTTPIRALVPPGKIFYKYFSAIKSHLKSYLSKFVLLQKDASKDQQYNVSARMNYKYSKNGYMNTSEEGKSQPYREISPLRSDF